MQKDCIVKQPLAVVGIACRFPGADNQAQFWELVHKGACAIAELPPDRLNRSLYYSPAKGEGSEGKTYSTLSGIVSAPPVDVTLCPEPENYDIAHLIMLEVAANACRDAGWDPLDPPLRNAGVYIGHARTGPLSAEVTFSTHVEDCSAFLNQTPAFKRLPDSLRRSIISDVICNVRRKKPHFREAGKPFLDPAVAASLVSQTFGFTGPHMVIDAACASSLVAIALAAGPLQEERIDMAIVGGASFSNWQSMALFSRAQALSASGSYPFDARADGFISSDGYAAIILKTLNRALAHGDRIHAVIRGIGLSSDGRGKSLWAPRKEGQIEAIRRAYAGGVDPSLIQYIEAHGTSTQLGDATELQSLSEVLGPVIPQGRKIPIASVKGNIGHTCETAGLAGLIKAVLAMQRGIVPPAAGFQNPSPEIDLEHLPFFIPTQPLEWTRAEDDRPRRAAVDAFGIGGLNVHLVVDEFLPQSKPSAAVPAAYDEGEGSHIAIIGAGAVFPGARTAAAFWEMLASGPDPKTLAPADRWDPEIYWNPGKIEPWRSPTRMGGFIFDFKLDPGRFRIPPKQMETADPLQYMVLDAADQALRDAGYDNRAFDRKRVAVIVGTMFSSDFMRNLTVALQYPEFEQELKQLLTEKNLPEESAREILTSARTIFHQRKTMLKDETGSFSASTLASRIARMLNLMGGAFALDAEEASSGAALDAAAMLLRSGACDMVLCAGAQRTMDVGIYEEYGWRGLLTADGQGLIPAEGSGMVLLKRAADARRDGDRIHGIIKEIRCGRSGSGSKPDMVSRKMGFALGASGIASVLACLAPHAAASSTVITASPRSLKYEIDLEKPLAAPKGRVAFLFPGQGSQYTGMLRDLVRESPAAAAKRDEIDALMKRLGYQTFTELSLELGSGIGVYPWQTQISMLLADVIVLEALKDLGVQPDVVAGHSYGEFPALVAAGALTLEQAIQATRVRADMVRASIGANCRLMAANASQETAQRIIRTSRLPVHLAIFNAAEQTILGGAAADLDKILQLFKSEGFHCTPLPLPGAFHTPLFADMKAPFLNALSAMDILPPQIPFLSSVTVRYVAEPSEIRENLAAQPSAFLNYPEIVQRLAADGVSVFVEVGPQQVLTRLNQCILKGRAIAVACDHPQKPGITPLIQVKTALESSGIFSLTQTVPALRTDPAEKQTYEILYFDATLRRKERNLRQPNMPVTATEGAQAPESMPPGKTDWSSNLIQFVCEQTGYAREVVDLDADLESDLGIDSIKKMQLFSELRERFDFSGLQPSMLSSFSTLRHVLVFLQENAKVKSPGQEEAITSGVPENHAMKIFKLHGDSYDMGREQGKCQAAEIHAVVRRYSEILGGNVSQRQDLAAAMQNLEAYFGKTGLEELRGLADGTGLPFKIIAGLNLAMIPDLLHGCSHFALKERADGVSDFLHGSNEDAPLLLSLGQSILPTALVRHPKEGISHLTFVLPGQMSGINGINARGLAVSSTLLLDRPFSKDANPGRTHPSLVKEILENAADIETAVHLVRRASRMGGWGLLISHQAKRSLCYLEYDENEVAIDPRTDHMIGANHSLLEWARNGNRAPEHSVDRLKRLEKLVGPAENDTCSLETAQAALRDLHDSTLDSRATRPTMSTVRRMDNLLSMVMRPARNEVWVAAGIQAETYQRLDLNELFDPHIMRRWVLRAVESPLQFQWPLQPRGASLVVGCNPAAKALHSQLIRSGGKKVEIFEKPQDALECLSQPGDALPIHHLFLMSGFDDQAPDIFSIYRVCQRWIKRVQEANLVAEATLAAATSLGGDFGFTGYIGHVEGGGLAGLLKAIRREFPALLVKIIDAPREETPDRLVFQILQEMGSTSREAEAGYRLGRRLLARAIPRRANSQAPVHITRGGAWIVTGGRSGITAYCAHLLAEKLELKIHVLGRSPEAIIDYPSVYHCCDVSDAAALKRTIALIRRQAGPIRGILHGAGVESAARFERKDMASVRSTILSKVHGALNLMQQTRKDPLEVFLGFGSISGRFGGYGQTDYSLASDMLAKIIQRFRQERPSCASIAFHWPAWDEIGMAMRTESRTALELAGQRRMPPQEGWEHLWAELEAGAPEGEVLILDGPGQLDLDGCMQPAFMAETHMPLIESIVSAESGHCVADVRFDPVADVFLKEHCYQGFPLLPAVAGLEALAEGAELAGKTGRLALLDVKIAHGLRFADQRPLWTRVVVDWNSVETKCHLVGEFRSRSGKLVDPARVLISGKAFHGKSAMPEWNLEHAEETWKPVQYPKEGPLIHGSSFQCLKELAFNGEKGFGRILAQPPQILGGSRRGTWRLPLAELDACLVACGGYALKQLEMLALPNKFDRLRFFRQPMDGEICQVQFMYRGRKDGLLCFDFCLFGADRGAIIQAEGYGVATVSQGKDL
jgi:acyl transferase domain-containing protein/NAD(P)-dependent dehydrogenase (short-subunit alcohol dehydrogenase family)/acyl carrier protein